jgi:periplasmic divalent cation tolerance protein
MEYHLLLNTCPDEATGLRIAQLLVTQKLAACVNIVPGLHSVYHWQGEVHSEREVLLLIKTRADLYTAVETALIQAHPYDVPEVIALPFDTGLSAYLTWIAQVTA